MSPLSLLAYNLDLACILANLRILLADSPHFQGGVTSRQPAVLNLASYQATHVLAHLDPEPYRLDFIRAVLVVPCLNPAVLSRIEDEGLLQLKQREVFPYLGKVEAGVLDVILPGQIRNLDGAGAWCPGGIGEAEYRRASVVPMVRAP